MAAILVVDDEQTSLRKRSESISVKSCFNSCLIVPGKPWSLVLLPCKSEFKAALCGRLPPFDT